MEHFEYLVPRSGHLPGTPHVMSGLNKVGHRIETVSYTFATTMPAASVLFFAIFAVRLVIARLRQGTRATTLEVMPDDFECAHC